MGQPAPGRPDLQVDNPIDRYAVGDRTAGLRRGPKGEIDIWISRADPGGARSANRLPAPASGDYTSTLRAYLPKKALLDGTYRVPAVVGGVAGGCSWKRSRVDNRNKERTFLLPRGRYRGTLPFVGRWRLSATAFGQMEAAMTREADFVARFREQFPGNDDEIDIFLAWLQENGPDEWHRWAINWNWDHGTEIFEWVLGQPNCDKGTALSVYYAMGPDYYGRYASVAKAKADSLDDGEAMAVMMLICEMWDTYSTYAYRPSEGAVYEMSQGKAAMQKIAADVPWSVPDSLATAEIQGEPLDPGRTIDGVPIEMLRALGEEWE
jgi:hypothetical protein